MGEVTDVNVVCRFENERGEENEEEEFRGEGETGEEVEVRAL